MKKVHVEEDFSNVDYLFVATKPILVDVRRNSFKCSKGYHMLKNMMKQVGISEDNFILTKLTKYYRDKNNSWEDLYKKSTPQLIENIRNHSFKAIVLLGKKTVEYLTDLDTDKSISKLRRRFYYSEKLDGKVFPNYHPFSVMKKPGRFHNFARTMEKLPQVDSYPSLEELEPKRLTIKSKERAFKAIEFLSKQDILACDIETGGFNFKEDKIGELGMTWTYGKSAIFTEEVMEHQEVKDALTDLFENESIKFVWHNGKYDIRFLRYQWDCRARVDEDTMLIHYALNENFDHDLMSVCQEHLNAKDYESKFKKEIPKDEDNDLMYLEADREKLRDYLAKDTDYCFRLYKRLKPQLEKEMSIKAYNKLMIPAANTLTDIEMNGIKINEEQLDYLDTKLSAEITKSLNNIQDIIRDLGYTPEKYAEGFGAAAVPDKYSPGSYQQNRYLFHGTYLLPKYDGWTTNKDAMKYWLEGIETKDEGMLDKAVDEVFDTKKIEKFNSHNEYLLDKSRNEVRNYIKELWYGSDKLIELIEESLTYRKKKKLHSTYVKGYKEALYPNGRVHTTYKVHGTKTGRLSSANPNAQNYPSDKEIKSLMTVDEGKVFTEVDYSLVL